MKIATDTRTDLVKRLGLLSRLRCCLGRCDDNSLLSDQGNEQTHYCQCPKLCVLSHGPTRNRLRAGQKTIRCREKRVQYYQAADAPKQAEQHFQDRISRRDGEAADQPNSQADTEQDGDTRKQLPYLGGR